MLGKKILVTFLCVMALLSGDSAFARKTKRIKKSTYETSSSAKTKKSSKKKSKGQKMAKKKKKISTDETKYL